MVWRVLFARFHSDCQTDLLFKKYTGETAQLRSISQSLACIQLLNVSPSSRSWMNGYSAEVTCPVLLLEHLQFRTPLEYLG